MPRSRRNRLCGTCLLHTLAGVAWPMWGGRPEGWPRLARCRSCTTREVAKAVEST